MERVHELGDASVPFEFDVHALIKSEDAPALEHALHKRFVRNQVNKVNPRREFFRVSLTEICQEVNSMGLEVAWTLAAEAHEFRETQAIERALANRTIDEGAWVQQQIKADLSTTPRPTAARELVEADA
jgi:hypothetical protein